MNAGAPTPEVPPLLSTAPASEVVSDCTEPPVPAEMDRHS